MIKFKRVRFMNMMSFGNSWTEINLDGANTTLVVGANGSGKSGALLDSMSFALFGKPFRKINKPQLVNTITNREMLVECEFSTPAHDYVVRRGVKPNVFEVFRDGSLVAPPADLREYQDWLEVSVLKFNHRMFSQVVVLGSATYVPFMQLPAHARREVIEGLLDIGVFSTMNSLLRERVAASEVDLTSARAELEKAEAALEFNAMHVKSMQHDNKSLIEQRRETISQHKAEIAALSSDAMTLIEQLTPLRESVAIMPALRHKRDEIRGSLSEMKSRAQDQQREVEFLTHSSACPTCKQSINEDFRSARVFELNDSLRDIAGSAATAHANLLMVDSHIHRGEEQEREIARISSTVERLGASAREKTRFVEQLEEEIEKISRRDQVISTGSEVTQELEARRDVAMSALERKRRESGVLAAASQLLKDGGVKARVIKQYVPTLNAFIAKYLAALDFFVEFSIDENFEETIRSRYRDSFSYESFSEGEKCRINLALLFAWRAVARLRNSVHCNVIIMDEILDGSLDAVGAEEFIKIISALTEGENVFVISHRRDNLIDKFERTLEFTKIKNFSQLSIAN